MCNGRGYVAKKCNAAEIIYSSTQGRISCCGARIEKIRVYSASKPFVHRTDRISVENLKNMKEVRGIYARQQNLICSFQYSITHRAGTAQKNADALCPNLPEDPATDELIHRRKRHCLWKICARKLLKTLFCKTYCHS